MRDFAQIARQYAEDVASGDVLACRYVQLACQRHLDDLARAEASSPEASGAFAFRFDEAKAARVCAFVELFPHVKGKWAREQTRIELEPWQVFILACVFGWVREDDGLRRFRVAYIEVARKNGKSLLSSAVALYMLAADDEPGAEVYCGATTERQAKIVFDAAKKMAERVPEYREAFGVEVMASNLSVPESASKFEPVIGKPGDGDSPHCAIVDEYHEHQSDEQFDTMWTGMGAREQPLMWTITTAGADVAGPCYALHTDVVRMLEGTVPNDELFGLIYTIDGPRQSDAGDATEGDDWTSDEALLKANPNAGVSVRMDYLRAKIRDAVANSRKQNVVKTKHLNVWTTARTAWMNMEDWNACADPTLSREDFAGEPCWKGLDLASKVDIASDITLFPETLPDGKTGYVMFGRHYLPEARVEDESRRHYQGWVADGHLIATDGDIIDHDVIRDDIEADAEAHRVVTVGYDQYNATQLAVNLESAGISTLSIGMTVAYLSDPMKTLEALVIARRLRHDGNPCMGWMMSNVTARTDANDNVFPRKEKQENKIDGPVAAIIALAVALREEGPTGSVYDTRGIREL